MDILNNQIVVALLALLAIPAVTSGIAALLRRIGMAGIDPRVVVYLVSLIITGVVLFMAGTSIPAVTGEPSAVVAAWMVWLTTNAEIARRLYELLLNKVWPGPEAPA